MLRAVLRSRDDFLLILRNRVFVDRAFLTKSKHAAHAAFVASVAKRIRLDNVAYRFSAGTRGVKRSSCRPVPTAVIAKVGGHRQCGALVPNPYFGPDLDAWDVAEDVVPFATRSSKALWRGNISSRPCDKDAGNRARLEACALSVERPDLFDAYCPHVNGCAPRDPDQCDAAGERLVAKTYGGDVFPHSATTEAMRRAFRAPEKMARGYVEPRKFASSKYLLHLPGAFTGSYSRNLNGLWRRGAVVLLWAAAYAEFYFPALEAGRTHLVVDACSAPSVIERLNADPRRAKHWRRRRGPSTLLALRGLPRAVLCERRRSLPAPLRARAGPRPRPAVDRGLLRTGPARGARRAAVAGHVPAARCPTASDLRNVVRWWMGGCSQFVGAVGRTAGPIYVSLLVSFTASYTQRFRLQVVVTLSCAATGQSGFAEAKDLAVAGRAVVRRNAVTRSGCARTA